MRYEESEKTLPEFKARMARVDYPLYFASDSGHQWRLQETRQYVLLFRLLAFMCPISSAQEECLYSHFRLIALY